MVGAPPPIKVEDLDREELLHLVVERLPYALSEYDLRSARWHVLAKRTVAAQERQRKADAAYFALPEPVRHASSALRIEREAKRVIRKRAARATRRAQAAEDLAWAELLASDKCRPLRPMRSTAWPR